MPAELRTAEHIADDPDAREILRVWTNEDGQVFAIRTDVWEDPAAWGLLLVDLARHAAQGIAARKNLDPESVLDRIREGFDAEWEAPTDL